MNGSESKLTKIAICYDGNYFYHVSNYYNYVHPRRARISIPGLHDFIRAQVAKNEGQEVQFCRVVEAHYFRGRQSADDASASQKLLTERKFDDILMRAGVVTHYLPLGPKGEKGVDVLLALETFELTIVKKFDVVALIASDGDFVPLARKITGLGTRIMVLAWDFQYTDSRGEPRRTITSVDLLDEVTYPVQMHTTIDDKTLRHDPVINNLFVKKPQDSSPRYLEPTPERNNHARQPPEPESATAPTSENGADADKDTSIHKGHIQNLQTGFGFITTDDPARNLFFFWEDLVNADFNELRLGDEVQYVLGRNDRGECGREVRRIAKAEGAAAEGTTTEPEEARPSSEAETLRGRIHNLQKGYGFITTDDPDKNLFFFWEDLVNADFNELNVDDEVEYVVGSNERGECAREIRRVRERPSGNSQ